MEILQCLPTCLSEPVRKERGRATQDNQNKDIIVKLSVRTSVVDPSATVALNTKAKALSDQGIAVTSFAVGEPDFPTPQAIVDVAIASLKKGRTKYGAPGGGMPLRKAIVEKLKRENNLEYKPDEIVVGCGSKEILFHLFLALINDGDEVLVPSPYWVSYAAQIKAAGGVAIELPLLDDPAGNIDPQFIQTFVTPKTVGMVINYPNNPSGFIPTDAQLKKLSEYILTKDWWVISDEIYEYLSFDKPHVSPLNLCPTLRDRLILVNGLAKGFCMTGWRVGYGAGPKPIMDIVRTLQSHSSTCLPGFIEDASQYALEQGKGLMTAEITEMKRRRDTAVELLKKYDIPMIPPMGAFYAYIDLRSKLGQSKMFSKSSSLGFSQWLLEEYHIAAVPGEAFGTPGFLRLSYAVDQKLLKAGIEKIAEALRVMT